MIAEQKSRSVSNGLQHSDDAAGAKVVNIQANAFAAERVTGVLRIITVGIDKGMQALGQICERDGYLVVGLERGQPLRSGRLRWQGNVG